MAKLYHAAVLSLVRARLAAGRPVRLSVVGHSMQPLLHPGDQLWVEPLPAQAAQRGDLLTVWQADNLVTHRLVSAGPGIWHTRGDNCLSLDPPLSVQAVLGRVVVIEQGRARIDLRCPPWQQINRLLGWLGWLAGCAGHAARRQAHTSSLRPDALRTAPRILLILYARVLHGLIRLIVALARQIAL